MQEIINSTSMVYDGLQYALDRLVADLTGDPPGYYGPGVGRAVDTFYETVGGEFERLPELLEQAARHREATES